MRTWAILHLLLTICLVVSLAGAQENVTGNLIVFAATSLTDAFEEIEDAFIALYPDVDVLLSFANSSTLAAQIIAGAPADVFASANELQMEKVAQSGRVDETEIEIFAHNRLTVIVPADNPADIQSLEDLAGESVLLVLAAEGTPIRAYTDAMLASHNDDYGDDFSERALRNLVSEESNVRQVVARVALGEADAGVVYYSDAGGDVADKLSTVSIDERHNQLASYPIAPLKNAAAKDLANTLIRFLRSPEAQSILADNGFCPPAILGNGAAIEATPETNFESTATDYTAENDCEAAPPEDG